MITSSGYKEAFNEAYYAALDEGATEAEAAMAGTAAQLAHMEARIERADDARKEARLWGRK